MLQIVAAIISRTARWPGRIPGFVAVGIVLACLAGCGESSSTDDGKGGDAGNGVEVNLPDEYAKYLKSNFAKHDSNKNKVWDGEELKNIKIGDPKKIDKDGDGKITQNELFLWYRDTHLKE